jgi:hypothetical protein
LKHCNYAVLKKIRWKTCPKRLVIGQVSIASTKTNKNELIVQTAQKSIDDSQQSLKNLMSSTREITYILIKIYVRMRLETYTQVLPGMQAGATGQMSKMLYG